MKPYSQRGLTNEQLITNYRIFRGKRVVENAFGILAQRWQLLLTTMMQTPGNVKVIVEACVCLHNLMRMRYPALQNAQLDVENETHDLIPGLWHTNANMHEVNTVTGPKRDTIAAKRQREYLRNVLQQSSRIGAVARSYDNSTVKRVALGLYCGILANSFFYIQPCTYIYICFYINIVLWLLHVLLYMLLLVCPAKCLCDYTH